MSQRRTAKILKLARKTIQRKMIYWSKVAIQDQEKLLKRFKENPLEQVQMDDLITKEHTKLKPLSVSIVIEEKSRTILGVKVSQIPAFGHLTEKSRKKYGRRSSHHYKALMELMEKIYPAIAKNARMRSDEHKFYPIILKKFLPEINHEVFKSERACVAGQGELKKIQRDPLFMINHTCAMFRANISALIRKTWCICKRPDMLQHHLNMYMKYHNQFLIKTI
jgi:hypothetical protein